MSKNFNLDENTVNNIKNLVNNGNISDAISQISPEMIENFSKIMNNSNNQNDINNTNSSPNNNYNLNNNQDNSGNSNSSSTSGGFDFSSLDMKTVAKITSALSSMNNKNDSRANLLYSLKPYLREGKKEKLDQYVNLLNMTKIADLMKDNNKENNKNG